MTAILSSPTFTEGFLHHHWNRNGVISGLGEEPSDSFADEFNRSESVISSFSPMLRREVVWYQLELIAQRDILSNDFHVSHILRIEGNQNVPLSWETEASESEYGEQNFLPVRIALEVQNAYVSFGNIRIDDMVVALLVRHGDEW